MKRQYYLTLIALFLCLPVFTGCKGKKSESKTEEKQETVQNVKKAADIAVGNETAQLLKDLKESGDYVNSKAYPSLIKASIVKENIGKNIKPPAKPVKPSPKIKPKPRQVSKDESKPAVSGIPEPEKPGSGAFTNL